MIVNGSIRCVISYQISVQFVRNTALMRPKLVAVGVAPRRDNRRHVLFMIIGTCNRRDAVATDRDKINTIEFYLVAATTSDFYFTTVGGGGGSRSIIIV